VAPLDGLGMEASWCHRKRWHYLPYL